jgi:spore maturation protein CgeB
MQVGVLGPAGPDRFADNIGDSLRRMGHVVTQLGPARPSAQGSWVGSLAFLVRQAVPRLDERAQRRIVRTALAADCEIVINVDARLMPEAVQELKRADVRVAFWYPDHVGNLGRQLMLLAPYDALFFKEPHVVERLRANLDLPVYYLPQGCNPRWHRPIGPAACEPYLVVAGSMYPSRVRLLERLISKGIPLRLYGGPIPRWLGQSSVREAHTGHAVFREEKARVFRSAAGVLNTMYPAEIAGVNSRLFEATGCGGAVLTEFRPTVPEFFDIGEEVLVFHDFDNLVDQATRLLNETGLGERLGNAAAQRAHRDHSYDLRVAEILERIS